MERHPVYPGIFKWGNKWWYDFRLNGDRHRNGHVDALDAHNEAEAIRKDPDEKPWKEDDVKFKVYADQWLKTSGLAESTLDTYRSHLNTNLEFLHNRKIRTITVEDARELIDRMKARPKLDENGEPVLKKNGDHVCYYAPYTIKGAERTLSKIMGLAVSDGKLGKGGVNPVGQIATDHKVKLRRRRKIRLLTSDELWRLLAVAEEAGTKWLVVFALALFTGLRNKEIRNLQISDIDLVRRRIRIEPAELDDEDDDFDVKTDASEGEVAICDELYEILEAHLKTAEFRFGNDYVVSTSERGVPYDRSNFGREIRKIRKAAGLDSPPVQLHHLRHTVATAMIRKRVPPKEIQLQMRHSNLNITYALYDHVWKEMEERDEATAAISEIFAKPVGATVGA